MTAPQTASAPPTPMIDAPLYGATLPQAFTRFWTRYATFTGRASRSEYWWFALANALIVIVLAVLGGILGSIGATTDAAGRAQPGPGFVPVGILILLYGLAIIVPSIALHVRRLHDANLAGWFVLFGLIPSLGGLILLVFAVLPSNPVGARFDRP
jgi:uncharacterized membrane protein YhaH (DUF805 family)